jgi:hypothetical protein
VGWEQAHLTLLASGYRAFWAFALVSWILAIIALASLQAQCYDISGADAVYRGEPGNGQALLCIQ